MERSRPGIGARIALAAALLGASQIAQATNNVRTAGTAEIQEAAGVTIVDNAPLQLVLTSGEPTAFLFTVAPGSSGSPASTNLAIQSVPLDINGTGFVPGMTSTGEILSVSMAGAEIDGPASADGPAQQNVREVIAQFN